MTLNDQTTQGTTNAPGTGTATGGTQAAPERTFTQADLDRLAGALREEGRQAAAKAAEAARLQEQGEFKTLYEKALKDLEDLKPYKAQAEEIRAVLADTVKAEIALLPEDVQSLVPEYDDPRKTLAWINANKARLVRPPAPSTDAGARGDPAAAVKLTPGQQAAARAAGMTEKQFIEALLNMGPKEKD